MNKLRKLALLIKENPNDSFSKFALALEFIKIGNNNKALALFENIEENDPEYVGVYYHLGKLYAEIGENINAIETYKKGIEVSTNQQDSHSKAELQSALFELEMELED